MEKKKVAEIILSVFPNAIIWGENTPTVSEIEFSVDMMDVTPGKLNRIGIRTSEKIRFGPSGLDKFAHPFRMPVSIYIDNIR